ncbi:MAG TPA: Obg family GTPase CgtA [Candidatus Azoamicus sp. OHIO1]
MRFLDEIDLYVSSGKGGNGCLSFTRDSLSSFKKPDGGNGGKGGNVYLVGNKNLSTFYYLKFKNNYKAEDGHSGGRFKKTGRNGNDLFIDVPLGTTIIDNETDDFIGEILVHKQTVTVALGGGSGCGSFIFRSDVSRMNKCVSLGKSAVLKYLHLELKILSDVGLLGFPNVGKSSFLNCVSAAKSMVADYEFTTIHPVLGVIDGYRAGNIVIADIPGIIENASVGVGLGIRFLKHLVKTKLLLHVVDISKATDFDALKNEIYVVLNELRSFDIDLYNKEKWLIFNKVDLLDNLKLRFLFNEFIMDFGYMNLFFISCKNGIGIRKLCFNVSEYICNIDKNV